MKNIIALALLLLSFNLLAQTPEQKLNQLGIKLPPLSEALGSYVDMVRVGNLVYLSGRGPLRADGKYITGKVGRDLSTEEGFQAARLTAINQLAILKQAFGSLDKVKRIVKVNGYVNTADSFTEQSKVMNGFSDLLIEVFGEQGRHARTSIGVFTLPQNMAVEVEMIIEMNDL
ncbi:enamine deaminase RidA (YjgF/YER057c/UK114 family) [Flavobacterium chryseum]|uniref:RidA family protein n=1 Tax=Flavobacterium sp. P3160 TaxID=2512113 RepID=UPI00105F074E|nr:RidA family protein [Flavobacterium sp. P3160]TDO73088.1 enamine deaminase RidA (YjgF/YER057c/UK114 family) [Flavobacterium sp. P3160]